MGVLDMLSKKNSCTTFNLVKESKSLEDQIEYLKEYRNKLNEEGQKVIDEDIMHLEYGLKGEKNFLYQLRNSFIPMYVLEDLYLSYQGRTCQIDYLVITSQKIYVVECKNLYGDLEVDSTGEFNRIQIKNGKRIKTPLNYNPIAQCQRHLSLIKQMKQDDSNLLKSLLKIENLDLIYDYVVVLTNQASRVDTKWAKADFKQHIIKSDLIADYIKKTNKDSDLVLMSDTKMNEEANYFLNRCGVNKNDYTAKYSKYLLDENEIKQRDVKQNLDALFDFTKKKDTVEDFVKYVEETKAYGTFESTPFFSYNTDDYDLNIFRVQDNKGKIGFFVSLLNLDCIDEDEYNLELGNVFLEIYDDKKNLMENKRMRYFMTVKPEDSLNNPALISYYPLDKKSNKEIFFSFKSEKYTKETGYDFILIISFKNGAMSIYNSTKDHAVASIVEVKEKVEEVVTTKPVINNATSVNNSNNFKEEVNNLVSEEKIIKELKEFRKREASKMKLAPYYVFNDATLNSIMEVKPKNAEELLKVKGLGVKKIEQYGAAILKIVNQK